MLNFGIENFKVGFVLTKLIRHLKITVANIKITERYWSVQFLPVLCKLQVNQSLQFPKYRWSIGHYTVDKVFN